MYLHHFVTMDTLIVPPPTGQGIIARQAFEAPHALVVAADRLTPPSKRSAPAAAQPSSSSRPHMPRCSVPQAFLPVSWQRLAWAGMLDAGLYAHGVPAYV